MNNFSIFATPCISSGSENTNGRRTMIIDVRVAIALAALVVTLASACGKPKTLILYEGPRQLREQVAMLHITHGGVVVTRIDSIGKKHFALHGDSIELLPGKHNVEVNYSSRKGNSNAPVLIEFEAVAGATYRIEAEAGFNQWQTWIVDMSNRKRVSEKQSGTISPKYIYGP